MRLTSSYGMKLTGDLGALENSIRIYRQALSVLIPIINNDWETVNIYRYTNQKVNLIEKWIHSTKSNQAIFDFDEQFPKLPTYLRRSAIAKALGIVSSYRSNIKRNQKQGSRYNKTLWRKVTGISQDIADKTARAIFEFGNEHGVDAFVFEYLDFKGKNTVKRAHFWRYKRIYKVLCQKAHQNGLRVARVNAHNTSRLAFDGSGWSKRGREITQDTPYSLMQFTTGKIYNADLNASYNIGARYFIRCILKTVTATQRLVLEAKVPQATKRSTCTLSHLINLRSELAVLTARTQA